ncbi:MAG: trypsin, partial [Aeromicrobium sp.]|nr:trypsin [Aeromicrobium sp.]
MTESNDPFAAKPYVPPANRDSSEPTSPATDDTAGDAPTPDAPPAPRAPEESTDATPNSDQDATIPVLSESERAAAQTQPSPAVAPSAPVPAPAPEDYSHRYEDSRDAGGYDSSAGSTSPTQTLPPFATTETAYSHDDGGSGGGVAAPPRRRRGRTLAGIVALAVLAGGAGFGGAWAYEETQGDNSSNGVVSSLTDDGGATQTKTPAGTVSAVAEKVLPSVVQINVKGQTESGSGTGIIISSDGQILTNNHVVEVAADNGTI